MAPINIVGALGLVALLLYLAWNMAPSIERKDDAVTFRYTLGMRRLALLLGFGSLLGLTILAIVHPPQDRGEMWVIYTFYMFFGVMCAAMIRETSGFAVRITEKGLDCRPAFRCRRFVTWDEVARISSGQMNKDFVLCTHGGYRFRIPAVFMPDLDLFLAEIEKRLPPGAWLEVRTED
jgi:hypothetical protein